MVVLCYELFKTFSDWHTIGWTANQINIFKMPKVVDHTTTSRSRGRGGRRARDYPYKLKNSTKETLIEQFVKDVDRKDIPKDVVDDVNEHDTDIMKICKICNEQMKVDVSRILKDVRFHYSLCYYQRGFFKKVIPPKLSEAGEAIENERIYTCPKENCTKRIMRYKEYVIHLCITHKVTGDIMSCDPKEGMKEVLSALYPEKVYSVAASRTSSASFEAENDSVNSSNISVTEHWTKTFNSRNKSPEIRNENKSRRGTSGRGRGRGRKDSGKIVEHLVSSKEVPNNSAKFNSAMNHNFGDSHNESTTRGSSNVNDLYTSTSRVDEENVDDPDYDDGAEESVDVSMSPVQSQIVDNSDYEDDIGTLPAVRIDKVHNCIVCQGQGKKEGRNMNLGAGLSEVKYHYAVCYYAEGTLFKYIDAGLYNNNGCGGPLEDIGSQFKYNCPFDSCGRQTSRRSGIRSMMGYKEYAIHCAVNHHILEKVMAKDEREGIDEVRAALVQARRKDNISYQKMPSEVQYEEVHTCLHCNGENKDGKNLSFKADKISSIRYHYASCYYDTGVYLDRFPPGPQNVNDEGQPRDILGTDIKYSCSQKGCSNKRRMGYKEFCIHQASDHGEIIKIMMEDSNEKIRKVARRLESISK